MKENYWDQEGMAQSYGERLPSSFVTDFFNVIDRSKFDHSKIGVDIGCGGGRHTEFMSSLGITVIAIDKSIEMLNFTKRRLDKISLPSSLIQAEIIDLPLKINSIDYVVSNGVMHNAHSLSEMIIAMNECCRVLKTGGTLLLSIFTNTLISPELKATKDTNTWITSDNIPMVLWDKDSIRKHLTQNKLKLIAEFPEKRIEVETGQRSIYKTIMQKI